MLRHLLTLCLITCTIGYGSVWALDGHLDEAALHDELSSAVGHDGGGTEHATCDHCCHAAAHLTGIWADQLKLSVPDANGIWPHYHAYAYSILVAPPGHPPKA